MLRTLIVWSALLSACAWAQAPIVVLHATYGAGPVQVDVTERVRSLVVDGGLSIQVNGSTLGMDPVPNVRKTLTVEYMKGFLRKTEQANDFETMRIGNVPPEALRITQAEYGDGRRMRDVADILNRRVYGGKLELAVNNDNLGGDPAPAEKKKLVVAYEYQGRAGSVTLNEGETLRLPESALASGSLRILSATLTSDVTAAVASRVANDALEFPVSAAAPLSGAARTLTVEYEMNGERRTATARDGETIQLNAAPAVSTLRVLRATYGAGRRGGNDVTRAVAAQVIDGTLRFAVDPDVLGGDPAPGRVKTLTIEYELDGRRQTVSARDTETVVVPPVTSLSILSATYGVPGRLVDATGAVRSRMSSRRVAMTVNGSAIGKDPAPGQVKTLSVEYEINGRRASATARDGEVLRLPAPRPASGVAAAPSPAVGQTGSAGQICLYREPNYSGESACFAAGQSLPAIANWQSGFRSVRLSGAASVELFDQPNFGGRSQTLTADIADLRMVPFSWWRYDGAAFVQSARGR